MLRRQIRDKQVILLIKKYRKSGVMEKGVKVRTEEGSPQGGNLSPLLANVYLNEFDQEFARRGVKVVRYADDIVLLAKSQRAAERLLESSCRYLEKKLKLKVNREKSRTVSVYAIRNFKYLGFAFGKGKAGVFIRAHAKSLKKAKEKLKELTSRSQDRNVRVVMQNVKTYMQGWLGYFRIASMKQTMQSWNEWLRRRIRMYIWKQWKKPKTKVTNLKKLGIPDEKAHEWGNTRLGYWRISNSPVLKCSITNERLARAGFLTYSASTSLCAYKVEPPYTERYVRWCERSATQLMGSLLLDWGFSANKPPVQPGVGKNILVNGRENLLC